MNFKQKCEFQKLNTDKEWEDKCNMCCILKCGVFGCLEKQCHCDNFKGSDCKKCKHKDICF